jgi:hypothetical protein
MKDPVTPLVAAVLVIAAASFSPASAEPAAAELASPPVVVELFTSQGCNSCPPADAVLGELGSRPDVLPLSFHVTYCDRHARLAVRGQQTSSTRCGSSAARTAVG